MWRLWLKCSTLISAVAIDLFWRKADKLCHEHRMARRQMKWLEERKITWLHRGQSSYRERHHCLESTGTSYCPGGDTAQLAEAWGRHLRLFVTAPPGAGGAWTASDLAAAAVFKGSWEKSYVPLQNSCCRDWALWQRRQETAVGFPPRLTRKREWLYGFNSPGVM